MLARRARAAGTGGAGRSGPDLGALLLLLLVLLPGRPSAAAPAGLPFSAPVTLHPDYPVGSRYMGVAFCGALALAAIELDGLRVGGLSGLAWDEERQRLQAVSDRGRLFELRLHWRRGELVGAEALRALRLRGPDGAPLEGADADAEGFGALGARARGRPAAGPASAADLLRAATARLALSRRWPLRAR
ncbi:MAG: esterase-like activity of phytase family protein [Proteobacteria bacterium]|nr:esterase-like activity of phytase family protein [Pseudomonadota bacterium]